MVMIKMVEEDLPKRIRELRRRKNLDQTQFGKIVGVSNKTVSKWERGVFLPDVIYLLNIADAFDISVDELLGREERINSLNLKNVNRNIICLVISLLVLLLSMIGVLIILLDPNKKTWWKFILLIVLTIILIVSWRFSFKYIEKNKY